MSLYLFLLLTGCGLKANPIPPASVASQSPAEQKLTASITENAVVLTWQLQNQAGKISYINIEKSQLVSGGNGCKNCPRVFKRIGQWNVEKVKDEKHEYRFTDQSVEKGNNYNYRLKLCDENAVCHESSTAEIDFK